MLRKFTKSDYVFSGIVFTISACVLITTQVLFPSIFSSMLFRLNESRTDPNILVVAIDEKTLNSEWFKRYQDISRCDYATLLRNLTRGDPKAVGVDVFFSQKSEKESCDQELLSFLRKNPSIIAGTEYNEAKQEIIPLFGGKEIVENIALVNTNGTQTMERFLDMLGIPHESDTKNSVLLYTKWEDISVLPISLAAYKIATNTKRVSITDNTVRFDQRIFPHQEGRMHINFFTDEFPTVSFIDVLNNRFDPELFRDKIIFVGATAHDIHDEFYTPYDSRNFMSGVMLHANLYNTLSANQPIMPVPFWVQFIFGLSFSFLLTWILLTTHHLLESVSRGVILFAGTLISIILGFKFGYFVEILPFITVSVCIWGISYLRKFTQEQQSKNEIRSIFSKYISTEVADELIRHGIGSLKLWGEEREISVFFSDLAGFTDLSENLSPENLWKILNIYFEEMSSIILSKKWTIDKFIWDAIMAFWNAPIRYDNHAELACEAAILQRKALEKVRIAIRELGSDVSVDMRIGINTGKAVIGNFWCSKRYDYTALGDTVNLASRLESINKQYGTNVIISESTYSALPKDRFIVRELDMITVKWKKEPVRIYELIGFDEIAPSEREKLGLYSEALRLYREKKFKEAKKLFEKIWDTPSLKFVDRCTDFIQSGAPEDWDGVYRFKIK